MTWYERLENRWEKASKKKKILIYIGAYTVSFLVAFSVAYRPAIVGKFSFVSKSDARNEHFPVLIYVGIYIRELLQNVTNGNVSIPLFNINSNMGEDIIGFINSLGGTDPLLIFSAFVPVKYSEYLYGFLTIFRLYLAGLSFSYFCFYFKKEKRFTLIGSIVYCFCGYAIKYTLSHPYYINPMILLPLLIVGTDKIIKKDSNFTLIISTLYMALCGYYHLYMITIMIGVYALVRFFEIYKTNRFHEFVNVAAYGFISFCIGIGLAAIIFIPAVMNYLNGNRVEFSNYQGPYKWSYYRSNLLRLIAPPGSETALAFAAIVLFALALLIFAKGKRTLKVVLAIALFCWLTSIGGLILNGFQYASNRWTFALALVIAFVVVDQLPELLQPSQKKQWIYLIVLTLYIAACFSTSNTRNTTYILVGCLFLVLTALILTMPIVSINPSINLFPKKYERMILCLFLVIMNVGINGFYKLAPDQDNFLDDYGRFGTEIDYIENVSEREVASYLAENPFGRVDSSQGSRNTGVIWNVPSMLIYSAAANKDVINFWKEIEASGNTQAFHFYTTDQQMIVNTLLSVKYQVERESRTAYVPFGYKLIEHTDNNRDIYENEYALPWGYTYDKVISYTDITDLNGLQKQEAMLQAIALDIVEKNSQFDAIQFDEYSLPYEVEVENCTWENGDLIVMAENAKIILSINIPPNVEGYIRLDKFDINDSGLMSLDAVIRCGEKTNKARARSNLFTWYYGRDDYLFSLGYDNEERTELTITFPSKGKFRLENIELYALPLEYYPGQVESLRKEPLKNIEWDTNRLTGAVDLSKDKVLCVSVPYSKGWSAKVDGEKVKILRGNYMFIAIPLTAGYHDVELTYCSPGLRVGAVVTIISLGIAIYMFIFDRKRINERENYE